MKHIKRFSLLLITTVLFSGLLMGLFPQRTEAALKMEDDYTIYKSYRLIVDCLDGGWENPKKSNTQDTINAIFRDSKEVQDGKIYSSLVGNDPGSGYDCNTKDDLNPALKQLGYDGVFEFVDDIGNNASVSDIENKLRDRVRAEGGRLDLYNKPDFQFWFWNRIFRDSKDAGGCDGVLNDAFSSNRENNSNGSFWKVNEDGSTKEYKVASYNVATGHEVEGIDGAMTDGKKWTCFEIAKQLTESRAKAYAERLKANKEDDDPSNDYTTGAGGESLSDAKSCESEGGVLSWIMCPVVEMLGGALNWVDTQISRLLEVDEDKIDNDDLYVVWSNFRNIGLILLIIAMLIMVISTALGLNFLDAYTVKKAMPRMVAAIVFMLLSWYVCLFLIRLSNAVGEGVLGIMTAPFEGKADSLSTLFTPSAGGAALQIGGLGIGVAVLAFVPGALGIVMSWFGAALLIIGLALLVLVARQMFIITLILFAPIAILTWIFPGNDKGWKFWWQSFSKLLLMYPMIMALIASGRIFAGVVSFAADSGSGESLINPLLKLTAYVIPYAFIPFTFKFAGGVIGNLAGMVNDRSKGAFDRLRKGRQQKYGEIGRNMKGGVGFRGDRGNFMNRASSALASGPKGWAPTKAGRDYRGASRQTGMMIAGQAQLESNKTHQMWKTNDAYQLALADESLANEMLADSIRKRDQAVVDGDYAKVEKLNQDIRNRQGAIAAARSIPNKTQATRRQAALELAATGYQLAEGQEGYDQLTRISRSINGDDAAAHAQFMDNAQYNLKAAGRFDLGGLNHGAGYDPGSGTSKASLHQLANAKPESIGAMVADANLPPVGMPMDQDQAVKALTLQKELRSMQSNATGAVRDRIDKELEILESRNVSGYGGVGLVDDAGNPIMTTREERETEKYDPATALTGAAAAAAGVRGWTDDEIAAGSRQVIVKRTRQKTVGDAAQDTARIYKGLHPDDRE